MKAISYARFGGAEVLEYIDVTRPDPGAGEVLIETTAIGVNFPDIRERLGIYNRAETRVGGVYLPQIGGLQVVGIVVGTGPGVDPALKGRKIMALMKKGAYAQFAVARLGMFIVIDDEANDFEMASLPAQGTTAFLMLQSSTILKKGESVLIHGAAGGVGGIAVQIAKALGAGIVIGTASSANRRASVMSLGADHAIAYDYPAWPEQVLGFTEGRGVDIILESIGSDVFEQNFACLATFGRHIVVGSTQGPGKPFAPRQLMTKAQTLTGIYLPLFFDHPDLIMRALRFLADGVRSGAITPRVAVVLPLSRTADAHRMLEERQAQGMIVLDPRC
jgi:NADPH2:quinone reductase